MTQGFPDPVPLPEPDMSHAIEVARIGIWTHWVSEAKQSVNAIFRDLMEYRDAGAIDIQRIISQCVHFEDRDAVLDALDAVILPSGDGVSEVAFRIVKPDQSTRRLSMTVHAIFDDGAPRTITGVFRDVTAQHDTNAHNRLLIDELNHRVKGILSLVQSVAYQTFRHDLDKTGLSTDFEGRLRALGKAHDLLVERRFLGAFLEPLAERILGSCGAPFNRVKMTGFPLHLGSKQAVSLSMVLHELSVNALKYGAFSVPTGELELMWTHNNTSDMVHLIWQETGGPTVIEPAEKGFGSRMIERAIALEFGGALAMEYLPEGVRCTMTIPFMSFDRNSNG